MYVIYEQLIKTLVGNKCFYQLHQFLQYHVLSDSKQLACLLVSIQGEYPPAYQLALDMLKRLRTADAEIIDILLSKGQVKLYIPPIQLLDIKGKSILYFGEKLR
jgi:hypothetical protein